MQPLFWLLLALCGTVLGYRLRRSDEVHAIALCVIGLLSGIWGLMLVPSIVQLTIGAIAISWLHITSFRH